MENRKLNYFLQTGQIPNILVHGPPGAGKRTVLTKFVKQIYANDTEKINEMVVWIDCTNKGIEFIRTDLKFFAKKCVDCTASSFKSIVLFDVDMLTIDAQSALRRCIEQYSTKNRFFSTVQSKSKLSHPILSRFCEIYIPSPGGDTFDNFHRAALTAKLAPGAVQDNLDQNELLAELVRANLSESSKHAEVAALAQCMYDNGWSGCDLTDIFQSPELCLRAGVKRTELDQALLLPAFYNVQSRVRCEVMAITTMLYMMYISTEGAPVNLNIV